MLSSYAASEEFLELVKSALLAALEGWLLIHLLNIKFIFFTRRKFNVCFLLSFDQALGPGSLFGLATFSHKIGLYDVQGPIPVVKNVFIPHDSDSALSMELQDVMPLLSFLAPVCLFDSFPSAFLFLSGL